MRTILLLAFIAASRSLAGSDDPSPKVQPRWDKLQTPLPSGSRHHFLAVDPAWRELVSYQRLLSGGGFIGIDNPSPEEQKSLYMEKRYFTASMTESDYGIKILTYYPNGKLYSETDDLNDENFSQHFFSDGSFSDFIHWSARKWIAGVAVDQKRKRKTISPKARAR